MGKEHIKYRISVREPHWEEWTMLWDVFEEQGDAEAFIKDIAQTYPEGTLLFITGVWPYAPKYSSSYFTRKAFIVDEYGGVRSMPRRWIGKGLIPKQWVRSNIEFIEPTSPRRVLPPWSDINLEELSPWEQDRVMRFTREIDPEGRKEHERYTAEQAKYERDLERFKRLSEESILRPEDLPENWWKE